MNWTLLVSLYNEVVDLEKELYLKHSSMGG